MLLCRRFPCEKLCNMDRGMLGVAISSVGHSDTKSDILKNRYNGSLYSSIPYISNGFVCTNTAYPRQFCFDIANVPK